MYIHSATLQGCIHIHVHVYVVYTVNNIIHVHVYNIILYSQPFAKDILVKVVLTCYLFL